MKEIIYEDIEIYDLINNYNIDVEISDIEYKRKYSRALLVEYLAFSIGTMALNVNFLAAIYGGLIGLTIAKKCLYENAKKVKDENQAKIIDATRQLRKLTFALQKINKNIEMDSFHIKNIKSHSMNINVDQENNEAEISSCVHILDSENKLRVLEQFKKYKGENLSIIKMRLYDSEDEYLESTKKYMIKLKH